MTPLTLGAVALFMSQGMVPINSIQAPAVLHRFGGSSVSIDLMVEPLNGNLLEPVEIRADLFQRGQSILAPVQKEIGVAKSSAYEGCFSSPTYVFPLVPWKLPIPEVKKETQFIACLRTKSGNGEWHPSGQISITAYPRDFAQTSLAAISKTRRLCVVGGNGRLRAFLQKQRVPFEDGGENLQTLARGPADSIFLAETASVELDDWIATHPEWRGNLIVFCTDAPLLPGVFMNHRGGFHLAKVTLPLLDSLSSDPRCQKTFLEILNALNNP